MALTISEAAETKGVTRNAVWLAIRRNALTVRKTSGGMWLIEEDEKWQAYQPKHYPNSASQANRVTACEEDDHGTAGHSQG